MAKKAHFIGNWKMNHGISGTKSYFERFLPEISKVDLSQKVVAIAPPFTSLAFARKLTEGSPVKLCAQNACFAEKGAYTGEVSPLMLKELGVEYVILGHSERRHIFGETNELIKKRVKGVYQAGLTPILLRWAKPLEERKLGETPFLVVSEPFEARGFSELEKVERREGLS
jgi:Triosephosphate isomerase